MICESCQDTGARECNIGPDELGDVHNYWCYCPLGKMEQARDEVIESFHRGVVALCLLTALMFIVNVALLARSFR